MKDYVEDGLALAGMLVVLAGVMFAAARGIDLIPGTLACYQARFDVRRSGLDIGWADRTLFANNGGA